MNGDTIGLVAVILIFSVPAALCYTYYRVRRLKSEERLAAIAKGVVVPMEPELSQVARSRRAGILLVAGGLGYALTFALIGRVEPDAFVAAAFGIIPTAIGIGYFIDASLVRRDLRAAG
ncbi:MAG TPA: DUF6249 domain-containing protein [Candidatus Acidoferrales bacterium]|nr:DUF6249 domain-containing protein [Candidatus Acidoferrales bacterium]